MYMWQFLFFLRIWKYMIFINAIVRKKEKIKIDMYCSPSKPTIIQALKNVKSFYHPAFLVSHCLLNSISHQAFILFLVNDFGPNMFYLGKISLAFVRFYCKMIKKDIMYNILNVLILLSFCKCQYIRGTFLSFLRLALL